MNTSVGWFCWKTSALALFCLDWLIEVICYPIKAEDLIWSKSAFPGSALFIFCKSVKFWSKSAVR